MNHDQLLLTICRQAIQDEFDYTDVASSLANEHSFLKEPQACFVTLELDGRLRGCIGSLIASRPLGEDIIYNAKAAAFRDPRFAKLTPEEFKRVTIELSLLSTPEALTYRDTAQLRDTIKPFVHGVILAYQGHQATFLPSVWEQLPTFESFFSHLLQKAGLPESALEKHPDIYLYTTTKIK